MKDILLVVVIAAQWYITIRFQMYCCYCFRCYHKSYACNTVKWTERVLCFLQNFHFHFHFSFLFFFFFLIFHSLHFTHFHLFSSFLLTSFLFYKNCERNRSALTINCSTLWSWFTVAKNDSQNCIHIRIPIEVYILYICTYVSPSFPHDKRHSSVTQTLEKWL